MSDAAARRCVTQALGDHHVNPINFTIHGVRITAQGIRRVLSLVRSGRIAVRYVPRARIDDGDAEYDSDANLFILRFTRIQGNTWRAWTQQALIVHEATHALCDLDSHTHMHVDTSEAAAYIAQCVFLRDLVRNGVLSGRLHANADSPHRDQMERVLALAWEIAGTVLNNEAISAGAVSRLREAVRSVPTYQCAPGQERAGYNGLPDFWHAPGEVTSRLVGLG